MKFHISSGILLGLALFAVLCAAAEADLEIDRDSGLIIAPGWKTVRNNCVACHSLQLVIAQRADRQTWLDTIRWMQETQNLWQFEPETEAALLDYLARNYPPSAVRRRAPLPPHLMPENPYVPTTLK